MDVFSKPLDVEKVGATDDYGEASTMESDADAWFCDFTSFEIHVRVMSVSVENFQRQVAWKVLHSGNWKCLVPSTSTQSQGIRYHSKHINDKEHSKFIDSTF